MDKFQCMWLMSLLEERRHNYGSEPTESDYSYRNAQDIVAKAAGFKERDEAIQAMQENGYRVYPQEVVHNKGGLS